MVMALVPSALALRATVGGPGVLTVLEIYTILIPLYHLKSANTNEAGTVWYNTTLDFTIFHPAS
jgi:hypothetical protein